MKNQIFSVLTLSLSLTMLLMMWLTTLTQAAGTEYTHRAPPEIAIAAPFVRLDQRSTPSTSQSSTPQLTFTPVYSIYLPVIKKDSPSPIIVLEDFDDIVTTVDLGFNDFSGNMGAINADYSQMVLHCPNIVPCALRFEWDFGNEPEDFTGIFLSLFGLTDTTATFDGVITETVFFPDHHLDLNRIDGMLNEPGGPRRLLEVCVDISYEGAQPLKLRTELKDVQGNGRFTRLNIPGSTTLQKHCWDFRDPASYSILPGRSDLDMSQAKELTFIIERRHVVDGVNNPVSGAIDLHRVFFVSDHYEIQPADDQALLDLLERRTYQYFLDWSSRKSDSLGIPQDRSTFGDLLTVGGIGFGLPAHIIAAERGWIARNEAAERVLNVLRVLDTPAAFGYERIGRIGYQGWFYHFLGTNGRRKLNFDFPETTEVNEALNTVELSTIDTGLALMGILAAQSYFDDSSSPVELEIRQRAQAIYDRVDWTFMLEDDSQQFYLGWKPDEPNEGPSFKIPDAGGNGNYSGEPGNPATLDYYTDEALIVALLAVGSETYPLAPEVYCAIEKGADPDGLVRTWPGSLFTYQFLSAFLDTRQWAASCSGQDQVDWFANSRQAITTVMAYAEENPDGWPTYGPEAWGISAAEGPSDQYHAYGAPPIAITSEPEEDGTITYYGMMSAASFGADLQQRVISALRAAWSRGHWHPRFGLPDAFNDDITLALSLDGIPPEKIPRGSGPWVQRSLFAIDQGPMLLHLENARSGLIWDLIAQNPNIQRALQRLASPPAAPAQIILEGEAGSGDGQIKPRSNASQQQTALLLNGETQTLSLSLAASSSYSVTVRYSNDNFGPLETVTIAIDGDNVGQFSAQDTGDGGAGWNNFLSSDALGPVNLQPGNHQITLAVSGGDGYGVEIDAVYLDQD